MATNRARSEDSGIEENVEASGRLLRPECFREAVYVSTGVTTVLPRPMRGVSGVLEHITQVGEWNGLPLYQASHDWVYGE